MLKVSTEYSGKSKKGLGSKPLNTDPGQTERSTGQGEKFLFLEKGVGWRSGLTPFFCQLDLNRLLLALASFTFAATSPVAIILAAANVGRLPLETTVSWLFSTYFFTGLGTLLLSFYYRQPLVLGIPFAAIGLMGQGISHNRFSDVLGAYLVVALFIIVLGATGVVRQVMQRLPLPIVMGMAAATLLPYGLAVFNATNDIPLIAISAVLVYLGLTALPHWSRHLPPLMGALVIIFVLSSLTGVAHWEALSWQIATPVFYWPTFNLSTILELTPPILVMALAVQNSQAIGILYNQGFEPPVNTLTVSCGVASLVNMIFGATPVSLAGSITAVVAGPQAGERSGRYTSAIVSGALLMWVGLFAPVGASLSRVLLSKALMPLVGGLAILGVLISSLQAAFSGKFKTGALFSFLITFSNTNFAGLSSAFWGLVGGLVASYLVERNDFKGTTNQAAKAKATASSKVSASPNE